MHDAEDRVVAKNRNGRFVRGFLYKDQLNPIAEVTADHSIRSIFIYGSKPFVPDYMIRDNKSYRIISDHLGSIRMVVDSSSGQVMQQPRYGPWGEVLGDSNPGFQPFEYPGGSMTMIPG